jgi:hypothetical protein
VQVTPVPEAILIGSELCWTGLAVMGVIAKIMSKIGSGRPAELLIEPIRPRIAVPRLHDPEAEFAQQ